MKDILIQLKASGVTSYHFHSQGECHLWLIWRQFQIVFFLFLLNKNSYFFPFLQGSNIALQLSDQSVIVLVNQGWSDFLIATAEIERISQSRYDEQPLKWAIY